MTMSLVLAILLVSVVTGQNVVTYDETPLNDDDVLVVPPVQTTVFQRSVVIVTQPRPQDVFVPQGLQFIPVPPIPQGPLFQFLIPQQQIQQQLQQMLLPSPQLPESCGSFIFSIEHATFKGRAYHFSWCHRSGFLYNHQQASAYCRALAQQQPLQFEAVRLEDEDEVDFISNVLLTHKILSFWTRDTSDSLPYELRKYIGRTSNSLPSYNCLSVDSLLLAHNRQFWIHESRCDIPKAVICEALH